MKYLYILLLLNTFLYGQKFPAFPADQHSYLGGKEKFYKDFQKILIEKKLKPCDEKNELFMSLIVINEDSTASLYDLDKLPNQKNTCAEDLTSEVLKSMTDFIPAKINGTAKTTVATYLIFPDAFFDNYKEGYSPDKFLKAPEFEGGLDAFRTEVLKRADPSDFYVKGKGKVTINVRFVVTSEGKIENVTLEKSSGLKQYDEMLIAAVQSVKKKWKPATVHDYPIRQRFRIPISFSTE